MFNLPFKATMDYVILVTLGKILELYLKGRVKLEQKPNGVKVSFRKKHN